MVNHGREFRRVVAWVFAVAIPIASGVPATSVRAQSPSARARAAAVGATLQYTIASDVADADRCSDAQGLRGAVAARLGYAVFDSANPQFSVQVVIRRERFELVGELSITALSLASVTNRPAPSAPSTPTRVLRAPQGHCDELLASAATTIAMTLDPSALYGSPTSPEPPTMPAPACPAPRACPFCPDPELAAAPRPESAPLRLDAAVGGGITGLVLPAATAHLQLEFGLRVGRFRAALGGVVTSTAASAKVTDVAAQLSYATLALCLEQPLASSFVLGACALGSAGGLTASRPSSPLQSTRVTGALGGRLAAELALVAWAFVRLSIDAQAALTRHLFDVGNELRWSSPALWLGAQLAMGVRFS